MRVLSLALLAVIPFLGGIDGGFIEDDIGVIRERPELREGGDLLSVFGQTYWRDVFGGLYRPLTIFSYGVDRIVWGDDPEGGPPAVRGVHLTNLLLNAAATLLLYAGLSRRLGSTLGAWFGAALFAVHPSHVEAVVHMVGRADLLASVGFLGAWWLHGLGGASRRILAALCYLVSLSSKEIGAALPAVLLVEALLLGPRLPFAGFVRRQLAELWPYAVALGAFLLVRGLVLGDHMEPPRTWVLYGAGSFVAFKDPAAGEVLLTMLHAIGEYLLLLVAPLRLSADYSGFPHHTSLTAPVVVSAACLALLVVAAFAAWRRGARQPLLWLSFFAWALLPVSNLVVVSGIVMAERALYLPSVAFCALFGVLVPRFHAGGARRGALPLGLCVLVVALAAARTAVRAPVWKDDRTLFEETVAHGRYRGNLALTGICDVYIRDMQADPAREAELLHVTLEYARESVAWNENPLNVARLAWLLERQGLLGESLGWYERMRRFQPARPERRDDVARVVEAILASPADAATLESALELGEESARLARERGDDSGAAFWTLQIERLREALGE